LRSSLRNLPVSTGGRLSARAPPAPPGDDDEHHERAGAAQVVEGAVKIRVSSGENPDAKEGSSREAVLG
jgi:hypothetical protein